ncbi:MAG TPA: creatininase family protein [Candidatus Nanoarchaeia archaeon]|nr:creatininase family protein [Candidatus Nanoarchaeia archaeon]
MKSSAKSKIAQKYLWLDELSSKEAAEAAKGGIVVIFPIGSVEEHGEHLPLCTDSLQSEYVAMEVAKRTGCLVAPPFRQGVCNAGRNFPGTISIGFDTLRFVTRDILSELVRNGFCRIIVLTGHAGSSHMTALRLAAQEVVLREINFQGRQKTRIMVLSDYDFAYEVKDQFMVDPKDGHGGDVETSRIMDIKPDLLKGKGKAGFPEMPRFEVVPDPETYFVGGLTGDPTAASKEKGQKINEYIIEHVVKLVDELKE